MPLYDLNAKGEVTTGIGRLRSCGYDLGCTVRLSAGSTRFEADTIFTVDSVSDLVNLKQVDEPHHAMCVTVAVFLRDASFAATGGRLMKHAGWPGSSVLKTKSAKMKFAEARALCALEILAETLSQGVEDMVDILVKPRRCVRAKRDLALGELILVPETWTLRIVERDAAAQVSEDAAELFFEDNAGWEGHRVLLGSQSGSSAVCPFWCLERTKDDRTVNMVTVLYKVQICGGPDVVTDTVEELSKTRIAQQISASCKAAPSKKNATGSVSARSGFARSHVEGARER